jgi:hypothetical protein
MDEQANGTGQAVERNPDGSPGGSKANPSPRAVPLTMGERRRPFPGGASQKKLAKLASGGVRPASQERTAFGVKRPDTICIRAVALERMS